MKRTIFLLAFLLIVWIAGSSYWYICKIKCHCDEMITTEISEEIKQDEYEDSEQLEDVTEKDTLIETIVSEQLTDSIDPADEAKEYLLNTSPLKLYFDYASSVTTVSESAKEYFSNLPLPSAFF